MTNKQYIEFRKMMWEQTHLLVPRIYAALAIALSEAGCSQDEIEDVFGRSQEIWQDREHRCTDIVKECELRTGICMVEDKDKEAQKHARRAR